MVDLAIIGVLLISGALAFARGAVRELFSIAAWVAAGAATYYGFAYLEPYTRALIEAPLIAAAATAVSIFVVTFIVVALISGALARLVRQSRLGALDRSLGFLFGLARGALLVSIAYIMMTWALPPDDQPAWLREARAMPLVELGAGFVVLAIPPEARAELSGAIVDATSAAEAAIEAQKGYEALRSPPPTAEEPGREGYTDGERTPLDQFIKNLDSQESQ